MRSPGVWLAVVAAGLVLPAVAHADDTILKRCERVKRVRRKR